MTTLNLECDRFYYHWAVLLYPAIRNNFSNCEIGELITDIICENGNVRIEAQDTYNWATFKLSPVIIISLNYLSAHSYITSLAQGSLIAYISNVYPRRVVQPALVLVPIHILKTPPKVKILTPPHAF